MKKQKIEDIFSSMENFSSVPPPELWGQIEEKLNKPKKKKRAILWWSAAACLLLGLMLPSIFHFNSVSEIKEVHTNATENNSVVLEENQAESTSNKTVSAEQNTINSKSGTVSSSQELLKQSRSSNEKVQKQETAVADADANNNTNSDSSNQELSNGKKNANQAVAENTAVTEKENALKSTSKNQIVSTKKRNVNQGLAAKTFSTEKQNLFNTASKNQPSAADKGNANQGVAEKTFSTKKQNLFNVASTQTLDAGKRKANQILAEKTFNAGTQNPFNANSKNQLSNSLFEGKQNSKNNPNSNNSFALNSSATFLNASQSKTDKSGKESKNELGIAEKSAVENQKSNSKFNDVVLSKQDSVQLAVLQNLEKGINDPENKKETEKGIKAKSNAEKWAVEVFAGVANSENYKNEKTLGHVNDSKQSNTYGVKTKYKINKKWAVGSGFKINELGQSIANVSYVNVSEKNNALASYSDYYIQSSATPQIATNSDYVFVSNSSKEVLKSNNLQTGNLDQSLKYIEMPLEVSYAVFSKNKTSISLNTGGFVGKLISNNVALDGNSIGKNIDANDFVYGSVLSSTVQYRIYKKTNVFVEPAMNYYLNPLSNQSFNQFQWGLNFGLNVSF